MLEKKLAIIILLTSCASFPTYDSPYTKNLDSKFDRKEINEPEQNKISFGKLGNSLVSKSLITFVPVIIVRDDFEYGINNGFEGQIFFGGDDQVQIFKRQFEADSFKRCALLIKTIFFSEFIDFRLRKFLILRI